MREKAIDKLLERNGETGIVVAKKSPVYKSVQALVNFTNLSLEAMRKVKDPISKKFHYVVHLYGGNNGHSDWPAYLEDITLVVDELDREYHVWLIELKNDCPDDVFDVYIGLSDKE